VGFSYRTQGHPRLTRARFVEHAHQAGEDAGTEVDRQELLFAQRKDRRVGKAVHHVHVGEYVHGRVVAKGGQEHGPADDSCENKVFCCIT